ncbi:MAG: PD-(D/E)XK nuclease family protein [Pseudomonadota bacterium]
MSAIRLAHRRARAAEERRLLYVAMTRAKNYLFVAACRGGKAVEAAEPALKPDGETWHGMVARALGESAAKRPCAGCGEPVWVWPSAPADRPEAWGPTLQTEMAQAANGGAAWLSARVPPESPIREVAPTAIPYAGAATKRRARPLPPEAASLPPGLDPLLRGTLVHRLLQTLPGMAREARKGAAHRYLLGKAPELDERVRDALLAEAEATIDHPELQDAFGEAGHAEVDITGTLSRGRETLLVSGRIDRLAVLPDCVIVIDFKTDAIPPDATDAVAPTYIAQMAAYRDLLRQTYPDRPILCQLVWTVGARVMPLPDALLDEAAGEGASEAA